MKKLTESLIATIAQQTANAVLGMVHVGASRKLAEWPTADRARFFLINTHLLVGLDRDAVVIHQLVMLNASLISLIPSLRSLHCAFSTPAPVLSVSTHVLRLQPALPA